MTRIDYEAFFRDNPAPTAPVAPAPSPPPPAPPPTPPAPTAMERVMPPAWAPDDSMGTMMEVASGRGNRVALDANTRGLGQLIPYLRDQENAGRTGWRNGLVFPHASAEGGRPTHGYGYKMLDPEVSAVLQGGTTDQVANDMLTYNATRAYALARDEWDEEFGEGSFLQLPPAYQQGLTDYAFNLGTTNGFPNFRRAINAGDMDGIRREHRRVFTAPDGTRQPMHRRNQGVLQLMGVPSQPPQPPRPPPRVPVL